MKTVRQISEARDQMSEDRGGTARAVGTRSGISYSASGQNAVSERFIPVSDHFTGFLTPLHSERAKYLDRTDECERKIQNSYSPVTDSGQSEALIHSERAKCERR